MDECRTGSAVAVKATVSSMGPDPDGRIWVTFFGWATHPAAADVAPWPVPSPQRIAALEAQLAEALALLELAMPIDGPAEKYGAWSDWHDRKDALTADCPEREVTP